ncbi:ABC transporter ATP-binding protein [Rhizosaccharibacter radicis]|uniref:Sn-glycerol-3-phosphate ABC transporter ATP-binding protein UgpC n=1 Tax=Rhizosaccharibacter radicis TaxID=2782605 RepID=A0ABT1VTP2_9PROT|nr:sn-glycerol-3-phosphate ABC transporter ATP-binding protein UgpC [Acetobacteraceae bacterium KSS12]
MATLSLRGVRKSYQAGFETIKGIDLDIADREFVVFVGPSGCGKSTLLRMIAGLEDITAGDLLIDGQRVNDVDPSKRGLAMVFQTYALYPHMTVADNMGFALKLAGVSKTERDAKVREAARILQLESYLDRRPKALSGGQRQRVAIGRAIVRQPKVFLFDEPLSNLDAALRGQTRVELLRLHEELAATMIYVTHDQIEAMTMADKIVVLQGGIVEQVGSPMELYNHPANLFVAGFIGSPRMNFLPVTVASGDGAGNGVVALADGNQVAVQMGEALPAPGTPLTLGIRPERLYWDPNGPFAGEGHLVERLGGLTLLHLTLTGGEELVVQTDGNDPVQPHVLVRSAVSPDECHLFGADGQALRRPGHIAQPPARPLPGEAPVVATATA